MLKILYQFRCPKCDFADLLYNIFSATRSVAYDRLARDQAFRLRSNLLVFTHKSQHVFTKNMLLRDQMSVKKIYIYMHIYSSCLVMCQKTILFHQHANEYFVIKRPKMCIYIFNICICLCENSMSGYIYEYIKCLHMFMYIFNFCICLCVFNFCICLCVDLI